MIPDYELIGRIVVNMIPWVGGYIVGWLSSATWDTDFDKSVFAIYFIVVGMLTFLSFRLQ